MYARVETQKTFGALLMHHRLNRFDESGKIGISRRVFARELLKGLWSESAIEKLESGARRPSPLFVYAICHALDLNQIEHGDLVAAALHTYTDPWLRVYYGLFEGKNGDQ